VDGGEKKLSDLDFADDTAAMDRKTRSTDYCHRNLLFCIKCRLHNQLQKSKNMLTGTRPSQSGVFIAKKEAEVVDAFTYIGSSINSKGDMDKKNSTATCKKHQLLSTN